MKRFIILLTILALVVSLSAVCFAKPPAGKANNILNLKTSVEEYENGVILVKGNIPITDAQTRQFYIHNNTNYNVQLTDRSWFHFDQTFGSIVANDFLVGEVYPLGYYTDNDTYNLNESISITGIPNGTNLVLDASIGGVFSGIDIVDSYGEHVWRVYLTYVDKDGNFVDATSVYTESHYDEERGFMAYCSITIDAPVNAVAFRLHYRYQTRISDIWETPWVLEDGIHSIDFRYFINKVAYDSALDQMQTDQITDQLHDIDQSLNDGFNRPLDPDLPSGADKYEDLENLETGLIQDAESYLDSYYELLNSASLDLNSLANTFTAVKVFLESVLDIPTLKIFVTISLLLGLSGTILGIVNLAPNMRSVGESKTLEKEYKKIRGD